MSDFPIPGRSVRGSRSGRPIMVSFDLLGHAWAMGVLWQLCQGGSCTFRQLQSRCESISPTVLNSRLKELRQANLLQSTDEGYHLTLLGEQLCELIMPLGDFSLMWAEQGAQQWARQADETAGVQ
jgi:DNA-binding HxlR family transcriptional regulator